MIMDIFSTSVVVGLDEGARATRVGNEVQIYELRDLDYLPCSKADPAFLNRFTMI